jgi:hypothetical protein
MNTFIEQISSDELAIKANFDYILNNIMNEEMRSLYLVILNDYPEELQNIFIENLESSIETLYKPIFESESDSDKPILKDINNYDKFINLFILDDEEYNPKYNINSRSIILLLGFVITDVADSGIDIDLYNKIFNLFTSNDLKVFYNNYCEILPEVYEYLYEQNKDDLDELINDGYILPINPDNNDLLEKITDNLCL